MTKEDVIECYMINDKRVIAEMLYDTIEKQEKRFSSEYEKGWRDRANREGKSQKSYTIGYAQGYLDCEKNKVPKDIRELLKDKE